MSELDWGEEERGEGEEPWGGDGGWGLVGAGWGRWTEEDRFGTCLGGGADTVGRGLDVRDKGEGSRMPPVVGTPGWLATDHTHS